MTFLERIQAAQKQTTLKAFQAGEKADELGKQAAKLDKKDKKTKEEENTARELRDEAKKFREQQQAAKSMGRQMGLGEKIIRAYFTYKLASLACHTLVGLAGGYAYDRDTALGHAVIDSAADKIADGIESRAADAENPNQTRAGMIEQTLESFEHMSQQAQEQGLTQDGKPLLDEQDKERIQQLADISRADGTPEQYAAKCEELGLNYNDARDAYEHDRQPERTEERTPEREQENTYSIEI